MKQFNYVLTKPHALHARPINSLMREASRFQSSVHLRYGERSVGLKDARRLMSESMDTGSKLTVTIEGKDEEAAVAAIQNYFVETL